MARATTWLALACVLAAAVLIAGCTSPTQPTTTSNTTSTVNATQTASTERVSPPAHAATATATSTDHTPATATTVKTLTNQTVVRGVSVAPPGAGPVPSVAGAPSEESETSDE